MDSFVPSKVGFWNAEASGANFSDADKQVALRAMLM
jgi:hypothetical protein